MSENPELSLDKILDGYPSVYQLAGKVEKRQDDGTWVKDCEITTECPVCHKPYTRPWYSQHIYGFLSFEPCDKCNNGENMTLVGNNRVWPSG